MAKQAWQLWSAQNSSVVAETFFGQLCNTMTCLSCRFQSHTFSPFNQLALELPAGGGECSSGYYLSEYLRRFTDKEILDGQNKYKCHKCRKPQFASKQLRLYRLPPVLILQLKRFAHSGRRLNQRMACPLTLDVGPFTVTGQGSERGEKHQEELKYRLVGVINHVQRGSLRHYTAFVRARRRRPPFSAKDDEPTWLRCDDSRVCEMMSTDVAKSSADPYVLFYERME